jgi:hypothetical protein
MAVNAGRSPEAPAIENERSNPMSDENSQKRITVDLDPRVAEGDYANLTLVTYSPAEFFVDFARMVPGAPKAKVNNRIILTPQAAKALQKLLAANVERWESVHGEIKLAGGPDLGPDTGFQAN